MSNQQKKNTFYGAAAILTVSTILVKIIGAIFKIPLIAILPEEAYGDFLQKLFHTQSQEFPFIFNLLITVVTFFWAYLRRDSFLFNDQLK